MVRRLQRDRSILGQDGLGPLGNGQLRQNSNANTSPDHSTYVYTNPNAEPVESIANDAGEPGSGWFALAVGNHDP